ncbi:MAG: ABC transporter permease [Acidobacteriota bacterium]
MNSIIQDIRYGVRTLAKARGFTAVVIIVLALGIGANTAIFTVVNAVLLRSLPYPDADQLVMLWQTNPRFKLLSDTLPVTAGDFVDWKEQNDVFEHVSAFGARRFNLTGAGEPEQIGGASVSASFFRLMGIEPTASTPGGGGYVSGGAQSSGGMFAGRAFRDEDEKLGADKVVVISYALWQRRFGGQVDVSGRVNGGSQLDVSGHPDVIGKTITLDGESYTIVGIAPEGFQFPRAKELPYFVGAATQTDLWRPMTWSNDFINKKRSDHQLCVIARLKSEVTPERAQTVMTAIAARLEQSLPDSNEGTGVRVVPLAEQVTGNVRPALLVLMSAVALVLLIACANIANLMLARASARQREFAIRTALGASRARIVRQLLTEALLLSLTSAILGALLSLWGVKAMLALFGENLPRVHEISVDFRVLGFAVATALLTSVLFGLTPALQASKLNLNESLKEGARGASGGARHNRVRSALVVAEVALSLVLLVGAGLTIKSLAGLLKVDPGFKADNTMTMRIALLGSKYPTDRQIAFFQEVNRRVESLPGVKSVGLISSAPLTGGVYAGGFSIEGKTTDDDGLTADRRMISPEYFNAMGVPLITGRHFTDHDGPTSTGVAIVSESWARRFLPDEDPIGTRIKLGGRDSTRPWLSIVGIAGDVRDTAVENDAKPCVYLPYPQFPSSAMSVVVRAGFDPKPLIPAIRDEVWAIDKDQPVTDIKTMDQYVADSVSPRRLNALLLGVFASLALVLASVGIYGVMAYSVTQRVHEIGIRMALGAQKTDVLRLVIGQGLVLTLIGMAIGSLAAVALTRAMKSLLFGVSATDPLTYAAVAAVLAGVALLACWLPARRAAKVDPMVALRCE